MRNVNENLRQLVAAGDWDAVHDSFDRMSNLEFRRAQTFLREHVLGTLPNAAFWDAMAALVEYRHQAFISCVTQAEGLAQRGELDFEAPGVEKLVRFLAGRSPEALAKMSRMLMPSLPTVELVMQMFRHFRVEDEKDRIATLLRVATPLSYYVLFLILKECSDSHQLAHKCCLFIIKKNDDMSFNMASILKAYFGLDGIRSRLSLSVSPYELSYIDQSYDNFKHVLMGKKPRVL